MRDQFGKAETIATAPHAYQLYSVSALARAMGPLVGTGLPSRKWIQVAYIVADLCCVLLNWLFVTYVRFSDGSGILGGGRIPTRYLGLFFLYGPLIALFCHSQGLYRTSQERTKWDEALAVTNAVCAGTALLIASLYLSGVHDISRLVVAVSALLNMASLIAWRVWKRDVAERRAAAGIGVRNILIVGAGKVGQEIAGYFDRNKHLGIVVKGFLDYNHVGDPRVLGGIEDLPEIARTVFADEVILTIPFMRKLMRRAIFEARRNNLDVKIVPDLYGTSVRRATLEHIGTLPVMSLYREPLPWLGRMLKRTIDVVGSLFGLFMLSPILAAIAATIKVDSSGPVLYRAARVGKKGRLFLCYKFRTMVPDADALKASLNQLNERQGVTFKIIKDPRITRIGRFLRKYSLDELPQLWNVLKGEMSLVGPRPPIPGELQEYNLDHLRRLDVTPGLTGLWQVTARRDPSFEKYVALDLEYIENWTLWLDAKILLRTFAVVIAGSGA